MKSVAAAKPNFLIATIISNSLRKRLHTPMMQQQRIYYYYYYYKIFFHGLSSIWKDDETNLFSVYLALISAIRVITAMSECY